MALYFYTDRPKALLADFKKKIDEGHIATWSYDKDGDFTHTTEQWKNEAWLRPVPESDRLALYIIKPQSKKISSVVYSIYHGRFIESMLAHCDKTFTSGQATALAAGDDKVG